MKRFVIHHNDADGKCCAAIIHFRFNDLGNTVFQAMDYTDPLDKELIRSEFEGEEWCEIWVVDFSLKPEDMAWCLEHVDGRGVVYWFDHHKTAIDALPGSMRDEVVGVQEDGEAACLLVWRWLFPERRVPLAVEYIADRDVWRFDYGSLTRGFYELYRLEEDTSPVSDWWVVVLELAPHDARTYAREGYRLYDGRMQKLRDLARRIGHEVEVRIPGVSALPEGIDDDASTSLGEPRGVRCLRVNAPGSGDLGQAIRDLGYDVAWCWTAMERDGEYVVRNSLYSDVVDVGAIAAANGGGGHKGAAGWVDRQFGMGVIRDLCSRVLGGSVVPRSPA